MSQALYRKWRPQIWDEVVGQQAVVQTLHNAVTTDRVTHAYLFSGPRGTGKTTVARLLAKAVNCLAEDPAQRPCNQCAHCTAVNEGRFLDLIEIDAASNTSVDDVRSLRDKINFSPNQGKYKVYIIDEVHMLSTAAFNALLKTLEEPPAHAIFVLATTEIHKIPATVLSRCQRHEFRRIPVDDIVMQLKRIVEKEKLTAEAEALAQIARQATGSFRDAISLLDQLASTGQPISLSLTQNVLGTAASQAVLDLVDAILNHAPAAGLDAIHATLDAGADPRLFARQVVDYLRSLLFVQMGNLSQVDVPSEARPRLLRHAKGFSPAEVLRMIRFFNIAATDLRSSWQPSLPLELALAETLESPVESSPLPSTPAKKDPSSPVHKPPAEAKTSASGKAERGAAKAAAVFTEADREARNESSEPAPGPAAPDESGLTPKGTIRLEQITKVWKQVCAQIKPKSSSLNALLNSCRPLEIKGTVLVLGFASDILRSKADTPEQIEIIRQAIAETAGVDVSVRCVITSARKSAPPDVKQNGMVEAALKAGGEIVDIQE